MTVYASKNASSFELSLNLACWVINFFDSLGGLFISLYMLISHDDLEYFKKEHRIYFITKKEYQGQFEKMEMQFKVKSGYYGVLFAISLVMLILTLIDFLGSVM
ncbi:UNKNOWN [Stylonychia lemnae]|uniref:DUF3899 domain-containing protein n=1 Tax=Stylonychia lemnae TaxID=5949 RepID=A0A077ZVC7_STYLE|nr:UNKNOWN [Stylonychia lemnae]|eukprot:CDW72376.1 UNKNOWN [Stylonychia lemnae]